MSRLLFVIVVAGMLSGCAGPTAVSLDKLLADGRRNDVLAYEAYENAHLKITGTVQARGVREAQKTVAEIKHGLFQSNAEVRRVRRVFGYVVLTGDDPQQGRAICYFMPEMRAQAGRVSAGERVTLSGYFTSYRRVANGGIQVQLDGCELAD